MLAAGEIDVAEFTELIASSAPSPGHCNTMGTAATMNSLAETLGMSLPGSAAIPAPHRDRGRVAYLTGRRIVEMVHEDLKPSDILTRDAFENAIVVNSAIGGSTNAPVHVNAIARHVGVDLGIEEWETIGHRIPLLVDMQPAGRFLGEEFHRAGGVPAVVHELMRHGLIHEHALTVNGRTIGENCRDTVSEDAEVIRGFDNPLVESAGFIVLTGNLFDDLNPASEVVLDGCFIEPSLADAQTGQTFQLERLGYFALDPDSTPCGPILNRTLTLKDTWAKVQARERTAGPAGSS
jgi:dihydroxy-acid dehydratase